VLFVEIDELDRLDALVRRRRLTGAEIDELVGLYQRAGVDLSRLRSQTMPDPVRSARLSALVARSRTAVTGAHVRCPKLSGQGSNRILIWKGTGSSAGEAKTIHSRV
jgi:hypothetical protein